MNPMMLIGLEKPHAQVANGVTYNTEHTGPTKGPRLTLSEEQQARIQRRRARVVAFAREQGIVTAQIVADALRVSRHTAWADLTALRDAGQLGVRVIQRMKLYYLPNTLGPVRHTQ